MTILHWLPIKTGKSGSKVTEQRLVTGLSHYPRARFPGFYRKPEYDCFSCISHKFILIDIEKL